MTKLAISCALSVSLLVSNSYIYANAHEEKLQEKTETMDVTESELQESTETVEIIENEAEVTDVTASEETEYIEELADEDVEVNIKIEFSDKEAEQYKKAMLETLNSCKEDLVNEMLITENDVKEATLNDIIDEIDNIDVNSMFEQDGNTTLLVIPLSDMNVEIEGESVEVDSDGLINEEIKENADLAEAVCTEDKVDIVLSDISDESLEAEVTETVDGYSVNYEISFDDFADGVSEMSNNMSDATAQKVTCIFPARVKPGTQVGKGAGVTNVYFETNIVGCNKHDTSLASITTKQFAIQNSDCSKSVKLGLIALADATGILRATYANSIYCVIEGMQSATGDNAENVYCNGKKKAGGHVNCSWFNGIGHSERFHYHKYI